MRYVDEYHGSDRALQTCPLPAVRRALQPAERLWRADGLIRRGLRGLVPVPFHGV
jgi:hypothetical protein